MVADSSPLLGEPRSGWLTPRNIKRRVMCIVLTLLVVNVAVLGALLILSAQYPHLVSPGVLALSFGLRHAVDADHIAAIDNVTRRLIQDGKQPLLVGLFFSLGHSSVVCAMSMVTVCGSAWLQHHLGTAESSTGKMIATFVSAGLLLFIGVANGAVAVSGALQAPPQHSDSEGSAAEEEKEEKEGKEEKEEEGGGGDAPRGHHHDHSGGLIARCCPLLFRFVDAEWKMVLVGFLFGLGFETSSEIALLALAAMSPTQGIPAVATLILPLLFAGAMSLVDTLDGLMMYWAYGFAASNPGGRRWYNLYLTGVSSIVAVGVGGVEVLGCVQQLYQLHGPFWALITSINDNFEYVGYSIIGFFALSALVALVALRRKKPTAGPIQMRLKRSPKEERSPAVWWGGRPLGKPVWPWHRDE